MSILPSPVILPVRGIRPSIPSSTYLAPNATIVGDVSFGEDCSIWFGAVVRGDVHSIRVGNKVNIQDGAIVHCTYQKAPTKIGNHVSIGHRAIVHGCTIHDHVLIGMGAIVMDGVVVESNAIVGAGAVVTEGSHIRSGEVWAGVPAKKIKEINPRLQTDTLDRIANNYSLYASWFQNPQPEEMVVWVNENNEELGLVPKMEAHQKGILHRAISILLYNSEGKMLIQQRAKTKYHWPMIWSNAVCSHPKENETFEQAAYRRIEEELNITCHLSEIYRFVYKAVDEQTNLIEHEYDVVFQGEYNGDVPFNTDEIEHIQWIDEKELATDMQENPENYSYWFKEIMSRK
jgi:isopentenyl-diphosphate delta-isomerase type 1